MDINFFESKINIDIKIYRGSNIVIAYKNKTLYEGLRRDCMSKIIQAVNDLSSLGEKEITFNILNMTVGDAAHEDDKIFFKNKLNLLSNAVKCKIKVNDGLYNLYA